MELAIIVYLAVETGCTDKQPVDVVQLSSQSSGAGGGKGEGRGVHWGPLDGLTTANPTMASARRVSHASEVGRTLPLEQASAIKAPRLIRG